MNKEEFIQELEKRTELDNDKCIIINGILEDYFLIGKNNKKKIVSDISERLNVTNDKAEQIYEVVISIIKDGIKNKLKNPFKSKN